MNFRTLFLSFLLTLQVHVCSAEEKPMNFIFILADDLGRPDLSGEGSVFHETPRIDQLAKMGMRFENGYASSQVCSPSRASIMLGQSPARHNITNWIGAASGLSWDRNDRVIPPAYQRHLPHEDVTIAEALKEGGYVTFFAGKWHLGGKGSHPEDHGFDINVGGFHSGAPKGDRSVVPPGDGYFSPYGNPKMQDGPDGESLPERLGQETADFVKAHKDRPFFAFLSFYSVHGPLQTTEALWRKYQKKAAEAGLAKERFLFDRTLPVRQVQDHPVYAGMMESMDNGVGIVLDALKENDLLENTTLIFTSDNGGVTSGDAFSSASLPFRGGKGRQWEGGVREPFYIYAPSYTQPASETEVPVISMDLYPTMLELAGLPLRPEQHADGVSLVPLLKGGSLPERELYWHYPHYGNQGGEPSSMVRDGDWKLIYYWEDGREELYHLKNDIGEQENLLAKQPDRAAELRGKLQTWLVETGARFPRLDPRFDPTKKLEELEFRRTKFKDKLEQGHARFLDDGWAPGKDWWGSQKTLD